MKRLSKRLKTPKTKAARDKADRPISAQILRKAELIAQNYRFVIKPSKSLGFCGYTMELPPVMADGATPEACIHATKLIVETAIASMLEQGTSPPLPGAGGRRSEQINIRLSPEEKVLLEEESLRHGFRGLSDFVRASVLGLIPTSL